MKKLLLILVLLITFFSVTNATPPYIVVLGIAQDAGIPQAGCETPFCREAWKSPKFQKQVSSIALVNPDTNERWIFDATPDFPQQFRFLK